MTPTPEEVQQALIALGSTPQEVHDSLLAAGCKGIPGNPQSCVIAQFLRKQCGVSYPYVRPVKGWIGTGSNKSTPLPHACAEFARAFDRREFPDLIQGDE